jgi:hypothetical protein
MVHFHIEPCVGTSPYSIKVKLDNFADLLSSCMVSQIFSLNLAQIASQKDTEHYKVRERILLLMTI